MTWSRQRGTAQLVGYTVSGVRKRRCRGNSLERVGATYLGDGAARPNPGSQVLLVDDHRASPLRMAPQIRAMVGSAPRTDVTVTPGLGTA
jgi:hypothetical protein